MDDDIIGNGLIPEHMAPGQGRALIWLGVSVFMTLIVSFFLIQVFLYVAQFMGGAIITGIALPFPILLTAFFCAPQIIFFARKNYSLSKKWSKGVVSAWAVIAALIFAFVVWINII